MSAILMFSIAIRLIALGWALYLLAKIKDWRIAFLAGMIALMAMRGSTSASVFIVGVTAPDGGFKSPALTQMIPPTVAATSTERAMCKRCVFMAFLSTGTAKDDPLNSDPQSR